MACITGMIGGGSINGEQPLIEADDSWDDVLAAKSFVLSRMREEPAPDARWFRLWRNGRPITAKHLMK